MEVPSFDMTIDGIFVKCYHIKQGTLVPQHAHKHSHISIIIGKMRMWKGENSPSNDVSGLIHIRAGDKHQFLALEDSDLYCIHNADHALIAAENQLEFV